MKRLLSTSALLLLTNLLFAQTKGFTEKLDGIKTSEKELTKSSGTDNSSIGQSGAMTTSIPLVTVTSRTMSFPLQLQYAAGITVDQSSGPVGLGWVLPMASIVRDYGAYEPDYTATSNEVQMYNDLSTHQDGWIDPATGAPIDPSKNNQLLGYDGVDANEMSTAMSDKYHVSVPGFISNSFWNSADPATQSTHTWTLSEYEQWKVSGNPERFTISQEFSRINELNLVETNGEFDNRYSYAAAIGVLPYVKNTELYGPTGGTSAGWIPDTRTVKYEDFGKFTIVDENGTIYVFGRPLRGQKYFFNDDPYWSTRFAIGMNANDGNFWKMDYIAEWLLTEIRSADYVDLNGNGIADDGDAGDWIRFEYTAPTKMIATAQAGGTNERLRQEVPMYREWSGFSQTDQASSLMRERAYLKKIVTPVQELDLTISQRMEVDHDFYSKPANKVGNDFYFVDRKYVSLGSTTDFDVEFPVETMKYDSLKLYSRLIDKNLYPSENTLLSMAILKYAEKGSTQELAVSSYLIRNNSNVDKLIDKPGDVFNINDYHSTSVKRGKTTLIGIDLYGGYIHETEKTSYVFEYGYNPSYDEIHKRAIVNKYFFPSLRQGHKDNDVFPDLRAESLMSYQERVTGSNGTTITNTLHGAISPYEFLIDFPYHERHYKLSTDVANSIESFNSNLSLTSTEITHPLHPIRDVYGYYYIDGYQKAAHAWSLTKITYPTGGQVSFEYERGTFSKTTDDPYWSFGENEIPLIREYNELAKKRSYTQDEFNQQAVLDDYYDTWNRQKTLTATFEVDMPEYVGIRLKSRTVDDRLNPVVVTNYSYGTGHMTSAPSEYVASVIGGYNSFLMRERLRHVWEDNYYPMQLYIQDHPWKNDYDIKMRDAAISNIALDDYSSVHFYETTDVTASDGSYTREYYGPINNTISTVYPEYSVFCSRLEAEGNYEGRYIIGGNILSATPIAPLKTELYAAGQSQPHQTVAKIYSRTSLLTKKVWFSYNSNPAENSTQLYNNTYEIWLPIHCPNIQDCVKPWAYHNNEGWNTEPVPEDPGTSWSTLAGNGNPKAFVNYQGVISQNNDPTAVVAGLVVPNVRYPLMSYEKWGSFVTRVVEEETNYKGMVTSKEYTYDPTHYYLKQEKTESLYAAEDYITTYEYAHEAYNGITTKFTDRNMLRVPCRMTTYLNSVNNANALSASITTYDHSFAVPKPLDSYQYETTVSHTTGTFTLVPFSLTGSNGSAWRISENDIYQYNRTGNPVSDRTNQIYTKIVAGNGLNTAKATIMSVERPFDATYTGFEDFSYRGLDAEWTTGSYLEENWHTNELDASGTEGVISHSNAVNICGNSSSYTHSGSVVFYHILSVEDIDDLEVGDEVTVAFDHNSTQLSFTSAISAIHPNAILNPAAQLYSHDYLICFTDMPNIPAVEPLISTSPLTYRFTNVELTEHTPVYRLSGSYARTGEYSYKLPTIRTSGAAAKRSPIRPVKIDAITAPTGCNTPTQEEGCYVNYKASLWLKYDMDIVPSSPGFEAPIARSEDAAGDAIYQRGNVNTTTPTNVRIICKTWDASRTNVISTQTFYPEALNTMWKQYTIDIAALKGNQQWVEVYVENAISQVGVNLTQLKSVFLDDIVVYPADGKYSYSVIDKFGNTTYAANNDDVFTQATYDEKGRAVGQKNAYGTLMGDISYFDQVTNWATQNNYVTQRSWVGNGLYSETRYYLDGFGKTKQAIVSDNVRNIRMVSETNIFDNRGRVEQSYKPYYLFGSGLGTEYNDQYQQKTANLYDAVAAYTSVFYEPTPEEKIVAMTLPQADNEPSAILSQQYDYVSPAAVTHPYLSGSPVFAAGTLIVHELINPDGAKVKTYIDNLGRVIMEEHEIGFDHTQNANGSITFGTTPQPTAKTWFVYDGAGRLTETYDPEGKKTEYHYNSLGLVVKSISPDRGTSEMRYDKYGQVRFTMDANDAAAMSGSTTQDQFNYSKYDKWGRVIQSGVVTKPLNNPSYAVNNYFDDIATINNQDFPTDAQAYRQVHVNTSYGSDRYTYSSNQPVHVRVYSEHTLSGTTWSSAKTDKTSYVYNADGQLNNVAYEYDGLQGVHTIKPVYNAMRLPVGKDYVNGANSAYNHQWRTSIDNFGRPTHNHSVHNSVSTQTGKYYYDPLGNLVMTGIGTTGNSADPHADYHVIKKNIREQLTSMMSTHFRAGLTYDATGNITNQYWSSEHFDPAGSSTNINQYAYSYDDMNRLVGADYKQSTMSSNPFAYFNNTSGSLPNDFECEVNALNTINALKDYFAELDNSSEPWAKDAANALNILKARYISGNVPHGVMTSAELDDFLRDYIRDCETQKVNYRSLETYFAESNHDDTYLDSLQNANPSVILVKYARITLLEIPFITDEDCFPNEDATAYGYLPDFPMPTAASNATKYDAAYWYEDNGNLRQLNRNDQNGVKTVQQYSYGTTGSSHLTGVTWTVGAGTPFSHTYGYDANGNLLNDARNNVSAIDYNFFNDLPVTIQNTAGTYDYRYDANGQRSAKHLSSHDDEFYIDGVILEYDGKVQSYQTAEGYATPNVNGSSVAYYYNVKDWLGTTRVVIDALGADYNSVDYYPYGKKLPGRAVFVTGYEGYRYQFTGHELDGETGYQYHGARYYNEELGKYMGVDPIQKYHESLYAYAANNPITFYDPNGQDSAKVGDTWYWRIEHGDHYGTISKRTGVSVENLVNWNTQDPLKLESGTMINLQNSGNIHFVYQEKTPTIYTLTLEGLALDPSWGMLTYNGSGSPETGTNRKQVCPQGACAGVPGTSCDEFPYASTEEGGAGAVSNCVPRRENSIQGGHLSGLYRKMEGGDTFFVVPVPKQNDPEPQTQRFPIFDPNYKPVPMPMVRPRLITIPYEPKTITGYPPMVAPAAAAASWFVKALQLAF